MIKMKVSDYIAEFLRTQLTSHVFEVAGGMITHILDSIYRLGNTNIISVHHEQAAAFAADAYGRCMGRPGIALATSGPGATNLLTGIGSCYFDSSPALFITGQVNTHEQKNKRKIRQLGFQETDIISMAMPITKRCFKVESPKQVVPFFEEGYYLTMEGRPGPVLIDIPMNIQSAEIEVKDIPYIAHPTTSSALSKDDFDFLKKCIRTAKRPLILVGNGVRCARASLEFRRFAEFTQIPVVSSLLGLDVIPFEHPLRIGLIGSYGNRWANLAINRADFLIVIGSRLDIRQTGAHIEGFRENKTIVHIDCDMHEINNRIKSCIPFVCDAQSFLTEALERWQYENFSQNHSWINEINQLKQEWPDTQELKLSPNSINPNIFMHALSSLSQRADAFFADVGNHQMWAAQSLEITSNQAFVTSGGMGAMGFALPAAIGHSLAKHKKPVVVIAGDGAFQMNIQELQTILRNQLPIKIVIINNQALGMIRQFQDSYFEGRYQSTHWGYTAPDFSAIAKAYGISSQTISSADEILSGIHWLWQEVEKPALLQVMVDKSVNVYPKIAFGKPIREMEPFSLPNAIEST